MAKQKSSGSFSFSDIGNLIEDLSKKIPIVISSDENDKNIKFISTGIYILNAALSGSLFGGIQSNRISTFAGDSGVGKSFLCYSIIKEAQKDGWNVIYIDTESSIDRLQLPNYGINIDPSVFTLLRCTVVEGLIKLVTTILDSIKTAKSEGKEIPPTMIFIDSVGMLASQKESEDALDVNKNSVDMTRAKKLASLFRIVNGDLGYLGIPLICTNHVYDEMSLFPKKIMKGGQGLYYSSSVVSFLSKAKLKDENVDDMDLGQSGITVTLKTEKNRLAKPKKIKFDISFVKGCNPYKGLDAFCRPEFFEDIGIAKGKFEEYKTPIEVVNDTTGEVTLKKGEFKAGGNKYYVRHLNKSFFESQLFTPEIFTADVLSKMDIHVQNYFKYKSLNEIDEVHSKYEAIESDSDDDSDDDLDLDAGELFG